MLKYFDDKVLKTALGAFLACFLASYFNLKYGLTAGIIAIISIQTTKSYGLKLAFERFLAVLLGISIFIILVYFLGFHYSTLSIFILIFMPLCIKFNLLQGLLVTIVLSTHILGDKSIEPHFLFNEFLILTIGLSVGNILNMYMPTNEKTIDKIKIKVENIIIDILTDTSETLKCTCVSINEDKNFKDLKNIIEEGRKFSILDYDNSIFDKCDSNLNYFSMRRRQYRILKRIRLCFKRLYITYDHSLLLSEFIAHVAKNIHSHENPYALLEEHNALKLIFSKMPLPETREEFENRATLFQLVQEMEEFLNAKVEYLKN